MPCTLLILTGLLATFRADTDFDVGTVFKSSGPSHPPGAGDNGGGYTSFPSNASISPHALERPAVAVDANADMSEDMQLAAAECAAEAVAKFSTESEMAAFIKTAFDNRYTPTWQCIVGTNFGAYVDH